MQLSWKMLWNSVHPLGPFSLAWSQFIFESYRTVKILAVKKFGEFGELQHFAKFFADVHNFHNIPYAMDFNLLKFFPPNFPQSLFTNVFTAKVFTVRYNGLVSCGQISPPYRALLFSVQLSSCESSYNENNNAMHGREVGPCKTN